MRTGLALVRTRLARRILLLFLACAVAPILLLAAITYPLVTNRLEAGAREQLRANAKQAGMLILARLEWLAGRLERSASLDPGAGPPVDHAPFRRVLTETADGRVVAIASEMTRLPVLDSAQQARLSAGRPLLLVDPTDTVFGRVWLVVSGATDSGGFPRVWGRLRLSEELAALDLVPAGGSLCLVAVGLGLACDSTSGASTGGDDRLTERWDLFLKNEFGAAAWRVTLSESREEALIPLAEFRRSFLLGLLMAVVLVFVLSHIQIRRRLAPLADLEAGTQRLRDGDFTTRVRTDSDDEFGTLGSAFNQMATDLQRQFQTLATLHSVDQAALSSRSTLAVAAAGLRQAVDVLGAPVVALLTAAKESGSPWRLDVARMGQPAKQLPDVAIAPPELVALTTGHHHLSFDPGEPPPGYCRDIDPDGARRWIVFSIVGRRGISGALLVGLDGATPAPGHLLSTGRQLADQLAVGWSNQHMLEELDAYGLGALTALARTIDASSAWTAGHSESVSQYSVEIARRIGFSEEEQAELRRGALLHDIGKIGVPNGVLDKPGPLNEAELALMRSHPEVGARIIESIPAFRPLIPLVLQHHELLDGSGYPAGLHGDAIVKAVRILTVADIFEALTANRPYRHGLTPETALGVLVSGAGTKYDHGVVEALGAMLADGWVIPDSRPGLLRPDRPLPQDEQQGFGSARAGCAA